MQENTTKRGADILTKVVLGLVALSVGASGGNYIRFRSAASLTSIASVGDGAVPSAEFARRAGEKMHHINSAFGQKISHEDFVKRGFYDGLLRQMIEEELIAQEAMQRGFVLRDEDVAKAIKSSWRLHDGNGNFSQAALNKEIRQLGITQRDYIKRKRNEIQRNSFARAITAPFNTLNLEKSAEQLTIKAYTKYDLEVVRMLPENIAEPENIHDEDLKAFFNEHKKAFEVPELRDLKYVTLNFNDIAKTVSVKDEDIKEFFKTNDFAVPEKRTVRIFLLSSGDLAQQVADAINDGADFVSIATNMLNLSPDEFPEAREFAYDELLPKLAAEVFAVQEKGKASRPIRIGDKYAVGVVSLITPKKDITFDAVKDQIKQEMQADGAKDIIAEKVEEAEKLVDQNESIEDIAKQLNLQVETVGNIDMKGLHKGKEPTEEGKVLRNILPRLFEAPEGIVSEPLKLKDGSYVMAITTKRRPKVEKTFEDVKTEVKEAWVEKYKLNRLKKAMKDVAAEAVKSNIDFITLAKARDLAFTIEKGVSQAELDSAKIPAHVLDKAFKTMKNNVATVMDYPGAYVIKAKVSERPDVEDLEIEIAKANKGLREHFKEDAIRAYINTLKVTYPVKENGAFKKAFATQETQ